MVSLWDVEVVFPHRRNISAICENIAVICETEVSEIRRTFAYRINEYWNMKKETTEQREPSSELEWPSRNRSRVKLNGYSQ